MKRVGHWWMACVVALAGCAAGPSEPVGGRREALSADFAAVPLPELGMDAWTDATAGCEGLLDGGEQFAVTVPDGLVGALRDGAILCVDALAGIELELEELGLEEGAESLERSWLVTVHGMQPLASNSAATSTNPTGGEPNPQPSIRGDDGDAIDGVRPRTELSPTEGEPNPQPSAPVEGEPNPQPSRPSSGSSGSTTSGGTMTSSGDDGGSSTGASAVGGVAGATTS